MAQLPQGGRELYAQQYNGVDDDVGLKTLLGRLNQDASQFVHDELDLAKLELREVAGALSSDVREAGQTLAKDLAKVGVALSLALMAGLALTAGAAVGRHPDQGLQTLPSAAGAAGRERARNR